MINELSLLKLNPETGSTKQKIIGILSEEFPLSAKSIHEKLQKQYSSETSYQATHKTLQEMLLEKTVEKNGNKYQLGSEWIQKSKKTILGIEKRYFQKTKINMPKDFNGTIELEFDSITTMAVAVAELLVSKKLISQNPAPQAIATLEYGYWAFKFRFEYLKLLADMVVSNPNAKLIIRKRTPFGEFIAKQYKKIGAQLTPLGTEFPIDEDLFVIGDCLIEIKFSQETKQIIEKYYNKWKELEDQYKDCALIPEPKAQIKVKITKNPEMAKYMRKQLEKVFEENK